MDSDLWAMEPQDTTNFGEEAEEEETRTDDEVLAECGDDDMVPQHDPLCVQVPYGSEALLELERQQSSPEKAKIFEDCRPSPPWATHPEPDSQIPPHTPPAPAEEPKGGEESPAISPTELESTPPKVQEVLDSDDDKKGTFKENNQLKTLLVLS